LKAALRPFASELEEVTSTVGGKAAGGRVVRERSSSVQQEDQAERRPHRGPAPGVLREAERAPQEEDDGGAQAADQASLGASSRARTGVQLRYSRALGEDALLTARAAGLRPLLEGATRDLGLGGWSVSCQLTTARVLRSLNRRFAGLDQATDVLAFPAADLAPGSGFQLPPDPVAILGDIFIAVPLALDQAVEAGEDPVQALRLLAVHGLLHLVGHDHHESGQAAAMTQATRQLLNRDAARRGELPPAVAPLQPAP